MDDEWLKEDNVVDGALASSPRLAERVHFPSKVRPSGIEIGDRFLLYGITELGGKIIGAGIFISNCRKDDRSSELGLRSPEDAAEWPWRIDIEMTEGQYRAGVTALADVAMPSKVDR